MPRPSIAPPPHPPRVTARRKGQPAIWKDDGTKRSVQIGIVATVLVHLLLVLVVPKVFRPVPLQPIEREPREKTFNIDLAPEEETAPEPTPPPKPFKFVEINPDAPDNPPDQTENFGAQNQQVAQEQPSPDSKSDAPKSEDKKETESTAIVSGRLAKDEPVQPPTPPTPPSPDEQPPQNAAAAMAEQQAAKQAQAPLPGFEKIDGDDQDSVGSNIAKLPPPDSKRADELTEGDSEIREIITASGQVVRIDPRRPQQRERVAEKNVRPAFLRNNPIGTSNIGPIAYNAKWSEYGAYLQRLIETVQVQWERLIASNNTYPPPGTVVIVKFKINDEGRITEIAADDGPGPQYPKRLCVTAITDRSPYGKWSDDMIAVLGHEQELTFTFHYSAP